ncbi:MAG: hypothetical protein ACI87E_003073 [Mariniblastus sp.]|jgi:hypothetical protein
MGAEITERYRENFKMSKGEIARQGFVESFGFLDILFFLLGIATAGKIALSDKADE